MSDKLKEELAELQARKNSRIQRGMTLRNSNGDIDPSGFGYQEAIDTLTFIKSKVVEQVFYEVPPAEYVPIAVGDGAFMQNILTNQVISASGNFFDGVINQGAGNDKISAVQAAVNPVTVPVKNWAKSLGYSIFEIEQALAAMNWDYITGLESARKKNWDLGIQETAFLGDPTDVSVLGLLTQPDVNVNTSVITKPISAMSASEFNTFISTIISAYLTNANSTVLPDTFVIPLSDWVDLAGPVSETYPNVMKIEWLQKAFDKICQKKVNILPLAYCEASQNASRGVNKNRYALYRKDPETIRMDVPVMYTSTAPNTANNFQFQNVAYGQFTGVKAYRPLEVLYYDYNP